MLKRIVLLALAVRALVLRVVANTVRADEVG